MKTKTTNPAAIAEAYNLLRRLEYEQRFYQDGEAFWQSRGNHDMQTAYARAVDRYGIHMREVQWMICESGGCETCNTDPKATESHKRKVERMWQIIERYEGKPIW